MNNEKKLTTAFGAPVPDNRNSATAGKRLDIAKRNILIIKTQSYNEKM